MKAILSGLTTAALILHAHSIPAPAIIESRAAEACGYPVIPLYVAVSGSITDRLYTTDASEAERALESGVYSHQSVLVYIYSNTTGPDVPDAVPFYRLWSSTKTDHYVTASWDEVESAVTTNGYEYQGVVGYTYADTSAETGCPGTVALHRAFNPDIEAHYYTTNATAAENALSQGYFDQGIAAYVFPA
ncbi:hypothetical protein L226DRAFT_571372 [Lentinus tigrinus ALCF2SS1-7]|uniref:DUF5648 domain-containing protein n=1 Tax=Lentinus tigrinus ALCF2SS1-6 TaxID=1328759 RepID=A0A5C2SFP3_9APHY|nr:hypothetical protein L227DRAFT_609856 [Lentinus tigrinus ALCF2SS1-6]RPD74485.1 hypothetical protein L226DRAFT_571372 [Lentinus tigrinus ALCF2SS1-7]